MRALKTYFIHPTKIAFFVGSILSTFHVLLTGAINQQTIHVFFLPIVIGLGLFIIIFSLTYMLTWLFSGTTEL